MTLRAITPFDVMVSRHYVEGDAHASALRSVEEKLASQSTEHRHAAEAARAQLEVVTSRADAASAEAGALAEVRLHT